MAQIIRAAVSFGKGTYGAIGLAVAAVTDPLKWPKAAGYMTDYTWPMSPTERQVLFVALAFLWMFVWYYRQTVKFEGSHPNRTMKLRDILRYVGMRSKWASKQHPSYDTEWLGRTVAEINRQCALGHLTAEGLHRPAHSQVEQAVDLIPAADWKRARWMAYTMVEDGGGAEHIDLDGPGGEQWLAVRFDEAEVERIWPRRGIVARLKKQSAPERIGMVEHWLAANKHAKGTEFEWR